MSDENELSADEQAYFESQGAETEAQSESNAGEEQPRADGPEADDESEPSSSADNRVPHAKFHEERQRRKEIEKQLASEREARARIDERLKLINEAVQRQNQPEQAKIPTPEEDPIGALKHTQDQLAQIAEREKAYEQQRAQEAEISRLDNAYRNDWTGFIAKQPDSVEAYNHFTTVLDKHFELRGVADPAQRQMLVANEERAIAAAAFQSGKSPAQIIYEQAKLYGYAPKVAAPAAQEGNKAQDEIERRQKALPASRSMSSAGGAPGDNAITAETLANMSEEEFGDMLSKLSPAKQRALLGG